MPDRLSFDRRSFSHWTEIATRYSDTDRQGHVNNAVFATLCESGRVTMLHCAPGRIAPPGYSFVIARITIDFLAELHWPGMVEIGTAIRKLGRTSVTLGQTLVQDGVRAASSDSVLVLTDEATRRPAPLPDEVRERLGAFLVAEATEPGGT